MLYYAKSQPAYPGGHAETVREHTDRVLERYEQFKSLYQDRLPLSDRDWELLKICVLYHDVGKVCLAFQKNIRTKIDPKHLHPDDSGMNPNTPIVDYQIPHSFLSVLALPLKELKLSREEQILVGQSIAYHHERQFELELQKKMSQILEQYQTNILPYHKEIERELGIPINPVADGRILALLGKRITDSSGDLIYFRYVLLKGLLHRFDHAASAHVPIELASDMNVSEFAERYIVHKLNGSLNDLQQFAAENRDKHLIAVAQTGMGKTEAGLLWLGAEKGIFTLPLRISINAMHERLTGNERLGFSRFSEEFGEEAAGLLHSTSLDYYYESAKYEGDDRLLEHMYAQSKELANKLIVSTIDQVLKFPFYYFGYEKSYASMSTCKVIIDELQAYDPAIAALLVRAMVMIDRIGGSFMIMTATLPGFYLNALERELKNSKKPILYRAFVNDNLIRHNIRLRDASILDDEIIQEIAATASSKKVLVICNTVKRAREVFKNLDGKVAYARLLHARFIKRDRQRLEKEILDFAKTNEVGVWVTTQLVEASLDIDFDVLYTEMSTLDSLFQRLGRCNRKGLKPVDRVNIHVCTKDVDGIGTVYDKDIHRFSVELLKDFGGGILRESVKMEMIDKLYDERRLEGTEFKKRFDNNLKQLKNFPHRQVNEEEAQKLLRGIVQVQVIPSAFLGTNEFRSAFEKWKNSTNKRERRRYRWEIENYSVAVNHYWAKPDLQSLEYITGLYWIPWKYCSKLGLLEERDPFD